MFRTGETYHHSGTKPKLPFFNLLQVTWRRWQIRNELGWPEHAIWIDRERLPNATKAEQKAYEEEHGEAGWISSWFKACDNAHLALIFVSEKSITSPHCEMEIDHIKSTCGDHEADIFFIAVDQKAKTYEFIDELKAQGAQAFKRGEHSGPGGAIDAVCNRAQSL